MRKLHLTLKGQWFDMILSGEKKEEYRELKDYWYNRLMHYDIVERNNTASFRKYTEFRQVTTIHFTHGYAKNARAFEIECKGIRIGTGKSEWGGSGETFILALGDIVTTYNI